MMRGSRTVIGFKAMHLIGVRANETPRLAQVHLTKAHVCANAVTASSSPKTASCATSVDGTPPYRGYEHGNRVGSGN